MKRVIGVYGLISSGKSLFSQELAKTMNALYIDADKIGHIALKEKKDDIVKVFGNLILDENNEIDRKKLRAIVFSKKSKLRELEKITHAFVDNYIKNEIEKTSSNIVIEATLLFNKIRTNRLCTDTIYIESRKKDIIKRLSTVRHLNNKEIKNVIKIQRKVKNKKCHADIIVSNLGSIKKLLSIAKMIGRYYGQESLFRFRKNLK